MEQIPNVLINNKNECVKKEKALIFCLAILLLLMVLVSFLSSRRAEKPETVAPFSLLPSIKSHFDAIHVNRKISIAPTLSPPLPSKTPAKAGPMQITTHERDTLSSVFQRVGLSARTLQNVLKNNPYKSALSHLKPHKIVTFYIKDHMLEKMVLPLNDLQSLIISQAGSGFKTILEQHKTTAKMLYKTVFVRGSLYGTAKKYNIPSSLIHQMTEIFTWDIDFAKEVRTGDQFTLLYNAHFINEKMVKIGNIVAVSYKKVLGQTFRAVQYAPNKGPGEYFTPEGRSLKKAFNRYPIRFSHISSTFSLSRYHPILHYIRAHKGVDLAAHIGTPIMATGSGKIEFIGRNNGYGNMVKIKHDALHSSIYGHMLKFQKGLSKGDSVQRGQIIGYVGQSGLASGPHCHYEFHINNQPKNPSTITLPRGLSMYGKSLYRFKEKTTPLLAQLKQQESIRVAKRD